jgi:hypothetical protein
MLKAVKKPNFIINRMINMFLTIKVLAAIGGGDEVPCK